MKLHSFTLAGLIFVLLFGGIGLSTAMNWWQTETQKVPVRYAAGEAAGQYNPADIRGSYTFGEVSELFEIPLADLQSAFLIPGDVDPAGYQLKSLEAQYAGLPVEIGTGSVRMFVAFYKGLPFDLNLAEDTYLLPEAVAILEQQAKITPEQSAYLRSHTASLPSLPEAQATASPGTLAAPDNASEPAATEHAPKDYVVSGKTTFQNVLDWGVPETTIEDILGEKLPALPVLVKDYASAKGIPFSELKGKLQAAVDALR